MGDADASLENAYAVMVDPDELMRESDKSVAGSDGLVRDPDDAMASPFTEEGQASALHPRADG